MGFVGIDIVEKEYDILKSCMLNAVYYCYSMSRSVVITYFITNNRIEGMLPFQSG